MKTNNYQEIINAAQAATAAAEAAANAANAIAAIIARLDAVEPAPEKAQAVKKTAAEPAAKKAAKKAATKAAAKASPIKADSARAKKMVQDAIARLDAAGYTATTYLKGSWHWLRIDGDEKRLRDACALLPDGWRYSKRRNQLYRIFS